jgi:hypothetical protein
MEQKKKVMHFISESFYWYGTEEESYALYFGAILLKWNKRRKLCTLFRSHFTEMEQKKKVMHFISEPFYCNGTEEESYALHFRAILLKWNRRRKLCTLFRSHFTEMEQKKKVMHFISEPFYWNGKEEESYALHFGSILLKWNRRKWQQRERLGLTWKWNLMNCLTWHASGTFVTWSQYLVTLQNRTVHRPHVLVFLFHVPKVISAKTNKKTNSVALSPQANYTDWSTATCRRNLLPTFVNRGVSRGERDGSPTVVNLSFLDRSRYFPFK